MLIINIMKKVRQINKCSTNEVIRANYANIYESRASRSQMIERLYIYCKKIELLRFVAYGKT